MTYRNDQWFGLDKESSGESGFYNLNFSGSGVASKPADNDDFIYPSRISRTINADGTPNSKLLKRGYIRSVNFADVNRNLKCQFQFNPEILSQSVTSNKQVLNFMQQTPEQFAQPMFGNVNFNFELFFDRSAELNNPISRFNRLETSESLNPWQSGSPHEVGVLHDLAALFKIIGLGVDEAMAEYVLKQSIASYNAENSNSLLGDDAETATSSTTNTFNQAKVTTNINRLIKWNAGNSAFLIPLPVRIVFSSLYVVEGFVAEIGVAYTKFNPSMVPMQCTVRISMEAKYIGFAKKDTVLTYSLQELSEVEPTVRTTPELREAYVEALQDLKTVRMFLDNGTENSTISENKTRDFDFTSLISGEDNFHMSRFVSREIPGESDRRLSGSPGTNSGKLDFFIHGFFDSEAETRYLYGLMQDQGTNITVSATGNVTCWRYTDTFRNRYPELFRDADRYNPSTTSVYEIDGNQTYRTIKARLNQALNDNGLNDTPPRWEELPNHKGDDQEFETVAKIFSINIGPGNIQQENFEGIATASSASDWDKMARYAFKSDRQHGGIPGGVDDDLANPTNFSGTLSSNERLPDNFNSEFYFFLRFQLSISVAFEGFDPIERTAVAYIYNSQKGRNFNTIKTLQFNWPTVADITVNAPSSNSTSESNPDLEDAPDPQSGGGSLGRV